MMCPSRISGQVAMETWLETTFSKVVIKVDVDTLGVKTVTSSINKKFRGLCCVDEGLREGFHYVC